MQKLQIDTIVNKLYKWFEQASWKKRIVVLVVLFIFIFNLTTFILTGNRKQYAFDTVQKGTITQLVTENGNVVSSNETDVFSPATGVLTQVYVKNGAYVYAGDNLFTVRSTATPQEQAAAYANYEGALNSLTTAQNTKSTADATMWTKQQAYITAQNTQNYMNNNTINPSTNKNYTDLEKFAITNAVTQTQKDFQAAEQSYKTADVAIADAQAQVNATYLAYQATQNATITAPTDGTVSNIIGLTGAKVIAQVNSATTTNTTTANTNATQNAQNVTPVLLIGNTTTNAIQTTVSEVDINKVHLGQPVTILFSSIPGKTYNGKIIQEDTYGTNASGVISYNVFVSITDSDEQIKPNMTASLTIKTAQHKDILTVANSAIVPYQNGKAVQIVNTNGDVQYKPVIIGLKGFTRSEIVSGVTLGTKVILGNTNPTAGGGGLL